MKTFTRIASALLVPTVLALTPLVGPGPDADLAAQDLSVELRGSLTKGLGDFGDNATSDAGLGAGLIVNASPNLSVYGGYSRDMFGCSGCSDDEGYRSDGFEAGAKLLAKRDGPVLPWVRGGLTLHRLTLDSDNAEISSDRNLGFQLSAGVDIPLGEVLSFSPAVRYQRYDAEFDIVGDDVLTSTSTVNYLTADFGLHIHLGGLSAS